MSIELKIKLKFVYRTQDKNAITKSLYLYENDCFIVRFSQLQNVKRKS